MNYYHGVEKNHAGALFVSILTRQSKNGIAKRARTLAILAKGVNKPESVKDTIRVK